MSYNCVCVVACLRFPPLLRNRSAALFGNVISSKRGYVITLLVHMALEESINLTTRAQDQM